MSRIMLRAAMPLSFLLVLAAPALAQHKTARFTWDYGGSKFGGALDLSGTVHQLVVGTASQQFAAGKATKTVRLFGKSHEAARIDAFAGVNRGRISRNPFTRGLVGLPGPTRGSAWARIRVAGKTVWTSAKDIKVWSKKLGPYDLFLLPVSAEFAVGPVPVVVEANAGVAAKIGISASLGLGLSRTSGPKLSGWATGYAYGWVSAGVGSRLLSAGVQADLRFASTTPRYELSVGRRGLSGKLTVSVTPIRLLLKLYASVFREKWTLKVYDWSMGSFTKTLFAH